MRARWPHAPRDGPENYEGGEDEQEKGVPQLPSRPPPSSTPPAPHHRRWGSWCFSVPRSTQAWRSLSTAFDADDDDDGDRAERMRITAVT
uniref:Uncharacterized protein n=1 Tax=Oryza rufipogon TaxID=4529 RepID=A0A0E0QF60_ORYRU